MLHRKVRVYFLLLLEFVSALLFLDILESGVRRHYGHLGGLGHDSHVVMHFLVSRRRSRLMQSSQVLSQSVIEMLPYCLIQVLFICMCQLTLRYIWVCLVSL